MTTQELVLLKRVREVLDSADKQLFELRFSSNDSLNFEERTLLCHVADNTNVSIEICDGIIGRLEAQHKKPPSEIDFAHL